MPNRRRFLPDVSWFQVVASALAAVTAAWIASKLGVAGTIVGAALGSFVVTLSSAFYSNTLHQGRTMLIQTERGTVIERHVEDGEISEAFSEANDADSPVVGAQFVDEKPQLRWKQIIATTVIVLAIALAGITTYELAAKHPLGDSGGGTTLGDTFGRGAKDKPTKPPATTAPTDSATTVPTATAPPTTARTTTPTPTTTPTGIPTGTTPTTVPPG
ncbi:MAG: hypothetical protein H7288_16745 [Kineosporiaceae bacterium]|nr:hypothetical protein [Aeromicrobium sp.]